jgi:general secretion pathway protein A
MYEKYYGLKESPFNITPDSRFLYLSHHHREAMAALLYGIRERKGFTLLTGEIGSGKTTLCRAIIQELKGSNIKIALILNTYLEDLELLQQINEALGIDASAPTRKGLIDTLHRFLLEQDKQGNGVALVIDEAQNLSNAVLEQIRLLGNLETERHKLVQIALIGQPELQKTLQSPKLEQLNQRIAVRYHLRALARDEIEPYIHHRLRVAGLSVPIDFTTSALGLLYELSGGVPRKINLLCDRALLAGYVASTYTIDDAIISQAAMDVGAEQWSDTTTGADAEGKAAGSGKRRFSAAMLMYALALFVVLAILPVLLSETGVWTRLFGGASIQATHRGSVGSQSTPTPILPPEPTPEPTRTMTPTPAADPDPTPSPSGFHLERPTLAAPWTYDEDDIVRVDQPAFCRTAAVLTLLATWGIEVNLQDFSRLSVEDVERLDVVEANRDLGLREVEVKGGLDRAIVYDVPLVVQIDDPQKRLSPCVVLRSVTPTHCEVADPMMGTQQVPRALFESFWQRAWVVYFDPDGLDKLVRGQRAEAVRVLQENLQALSFYQGPLTGNFDRATVTAIEYLQRYFELFPTGRLDPLTVMLLTSHGDPDRPRLVAQEDDRL